MAQGPEEYFKAGLVLLKSGNDREATEAFRRALELAPSEPEVPLLPRAVPGAGSSGGPKRRFGCARKRRERIFCRPDISLNLGRVYLLAGNRKKAYDALRQGHRVDRTDR
jgi:tetratricopeptide (TPR) repeat protein